MNTKARQGDKSEDKERWTQTFGLLELPFIGCGGGGGYMDQHGLKAQGQSRKEKLSTLEDTSNREHQNNHS